MIRIGIAGIGFMGVTHFDAWANVQNARVTALCTRNEKKLEGDWSSIQGNFGGAGGKRDLTSYARYRQFEDLLADPDIDAVDLCLPTPRHREAAIAALDAGKHVILEKPIALTAEDADAITAAAQQSDRLLFVAQVLRFMPEWRFVKQCVDDGRYGKLLALNLTRVISVPNWSADIADFASNGGPLIDLHIHDSDFVLYLLGKPARVHSIGRSHQGVVTYVATNYDFGAEGPTVSAQSGAAASKGRPFHHGFEACFEKATLTHSAATEPGQPDAAQHQSIAQVLTIYHDDGRMEYPATDGPDGFTGELSHAAECMAARRASDIIGPQSARDALQLVLLEAQSIEQRQAVDVP